MKRHVNIPIFIPHLGCPNQCVFCNQRSISGVNEFDASFVDEIILNSLSTVSSSDDVEIAFFGGSFTGIDRELMISLLKTAKAYIDKGCVNSIRCSTRPDYINQEVLDILKQYGVKVIELGLQSASDEVLLASKRGHNFDSEKNACELVLKNGFTLVGQMMIGLPFSTAETEEKTAEFIVNSGAKAARIYPTVVFHETELKAMTELGVYTPLSLDEAVIRSKSALKILNDGGVEVIRIGLCASENLSSDKTYYKGPNHSALGELVEGEYYYDILCELIGKSNKLSKKTTVLAPANATSKVLGHKRKNKIRILDKFGIEVSVKEDSSLSRYQLKINDEGKE